MMPFLDRRSRCNSWAAYAVGLTACSGLQLQPIFVQELPVSVWPKTTVHETKFGPKTYRFLQRIQACLPCYSAHVSIELAKGRADIMVTYPYCRRWRSMSVSAYPCVRA